MPDILSFQVPADHQLETMEHWSEVGDRTFFAVRAHIIGFKRRENTILKGPPLNVISIPAGSEYLNKQARATVIKNSGEIQQSVQDTIASKFSSEIAQKIASELSISGPLPNAKISAEVQLKAGLELTEAVQQNVASKRAFEVQYSESIEKTYLIKPSGDGAKSPPRNLTFYVGLWPWRMDFYLHRVEYLRLQYQRNWFWPDVRSTIRKNMLELKQPLFSVRYYEPQDELSIIDSDYVLDVSDPKDIVIEALVDPMPTGSFPLSSTLEDLARLAFPVNRQERQQAAKRRKIAATGYAAGSGRFAAKSGAKSAGGAKRSAAKSGAKSSKSASGAKRGAAKSGAKSSKSASGAKRGGAKSGAKSSKSASGAKRGGAKSASSGKSASRGLSAAKGR